MINFWTFYISDRNFVIANAQIETYPIIFCNDGFCDLTGFSRAEVMQKSCLCEFLHCSSTSTYSVLQIKEALRGTEEKQVEVMYSRKDSKNFNNSSFLAHLSQKLKWAFLIKICVLSVVVGLW